MVTKIQKISNLSKEIKNGITNFKFNQNEEFNVLDNNYLLLKEYIQNHA